ncbi:MAG: hypothetical protein HY908_07325 [Myxococcales bacterium]|nr:hypothetical protein [Myxococcales bacterium]
MTARRGVVLDAGAFIALERRKPVMVHLCQRFREARTPLVTSACVVAQIWRGGAGVQAPVAWLLRSVEVEDLTRAVAKVVGRMLGATGATDPADAHVVLLARLRDWAVLTSDAGDLRALDPTLALQEI